MPLGALVDTSSGSESDAPVEIGGGFGPRLALKRVTTGRHVVELLEGARMAKLECEADPSPENFDVLRNAIKVIEGMLPNPWSELGARLTFPSLVDRVERISGTNTALQDLERCGLALFSGHSWGKAAMPFYYPGAGMVAGDENDPKMVKAARLLIAAYESERVSVREWTSWPVDLADLSNDDDDMPF
jgi:hypothetical protein